MDITDVAMAITPDATCVKCNSSVADPLIIIAVPTFAAYPVLVMFGIASTSDATFVNPARIILIVTRISTGASFGTICSF